MVDGMTFKEYVANEKKKWKEMNGRQKASYFKSYYLIPTIVILVILIVAVNIILDTTVRKKIPLYTICAVNVNGGEEAAETLAEDIKSYLGAEGRETVYVNSLGTGDVNSTTALSVQMAAGTIDALLLDQEAYDNFAGTGSYADVSLLLTINQYEQIKDKVLKLDYSDDYASGIYPAAINLSGTDFAKKYYPNQDTLYLVPVVEGENNEKLADLLKFAGIIE